MTLAYALDVTPDSISSQFPITTAAETKDYTNINKVALKSELILQITAHRSTYPELVLLVKSLWQCKRRSLLLLSLLSLLLSHLLLSLLLRFAKHCKNDGVINAETAKAEYKIARLVLPRSPSVGATFVFTIG